MKFASIADYNRWDEEDRSAHLRAALTGPAALLFWKVTSASYEEIVEKLRSRFGSREQEEKHRIQLQYRRRKEGESLPELAQDVERLVALSYSHTDPDTRDLLARNSFIDALDKPGLILKVREKEPATLQQALALAVKLEVLYNSMNQQKEAVRPRQVRSTQLENKKKENTLSQSGTASPRQPRRNHVDNGKETSSNKKPEGQSCPTQPQSAISALKEDIDRLRRHVDGSVSRLAEMFKSSLPMPTSMLQASMPVSSSTQPSCQQPYYFDMLRSAPRQVPPYTDITTQQSLPDCQTLSSAGPGEPSRRPIRCFNCNEPGHLRRQCPYEQRLRGRTDNLSAPAVARGVAEHSGRVHLKVTINDKLYSCLLDSGCDVTLIPSKMVRKDRIWSTEQRCLAANGTQVPIIGWTIIQARIDRIPVEISGLVTEHVADCMLGIDWLRQNNIIWDFARGQIRVDDRVYELESRKRKQDWCRRVVLAEDVVVPARSQLDINTKVVFSGLNVDNGPLNLSYDVEEQWGTESHEIKSGLLVARTLLPNRAEGLPVRVMNVNDEPVGLYKDTVIGPLEPLQPLHQQHSATTPDESSEYEDIIQDMMDKVDPSVSGDIRTRLQNLLRRYSTIFSRNEWDLGWTDVVTHHIDVGNSKPFRQRMRWYPRPHLEAIDQHVSTMLKQGVIEPCQSEYASNVVLAKKKDGTLRCCIDYRQLNDLTRKHSYPLPSMSQSLDALSGSRYFTTVDLRSGYHQLSMNPADSDKTAFITRRGIFRFRTMPFGLCNAVATFQRLMDLVLQGLNLDICLVYLDDVVIFSSTPEQHLERLEVVFQRLQSANLKLKPSKCCLMQTKITFLGHVISAEGVATDPEKIRLITDWPVPTNLRQLRGFLGLAGYYRKFVGGFSRIATPLNELTKKGRSFVWTRDSQGAFEALKEALSTPPVLCLPNEEGNLILDTDASDRSIGAVLSQVQEGCERVVAYAGRTLNSNEVNYCITRKELLAIVYFTKHFRQYLLGRRFIARTDHAALSWLRKMDRPVGQNARWMEQLEEYTFDVEHRRGKSHSNADSISRHPCLNNPNCTACHPEKFICATTTHQETEQESTLEELGTADNRSSIPRSSVERPLSGASVQDSEESSVGWTTAEIIAEQQNDSDIRPIIQLLSTYDKKPDWKIVELQSAVVKSLWQEWSRLDLKNGILCRKWTPLYGGTENWQIILPRSYRKDFIRMTHVGMTGGHLGRSKTQDQVSRRVYWPGWREDVTTEVRRCPECAPYFRGKAPRQTPLQPFSAGEPFEIIAVDITGPHPTSTRGNRYIVTATCLFSRWSEAYAVRNHTAPIVAKVLMDNIFTKFGMPRRLLSDLGVEFESQLFGELCQRMGIENIRSTAYKPSTNGCVERFHRTLNSMLAKVIDDNQKDWDDRLPSVMAAYRASRHASTNFTPNVLVLGRENRAPVDIVLGIVKGEEHHCDSYDEYVEQLQKRMRDSHQLAREHLQVTAERRKVDYDVKVRSIKFVPGQWVWYYYPRRFMNKSPKWTKFYTGPYLVIRVIEPGDYVIQRTKKSTPIVVHGDKLKCCYGETPLSWIASTPSADEISNADQRSSEKQLTEQSVPVNSANGEVGPSDGNVKKRQVRQRRRIIDDWPTYEGEDGFMKRPRPERTRRLPTRFQNYHL